MTKRADRETPELSRLVGDLAELLERLIDMQQRMIDLIREKLQAMRAADIDAMESSAVREGQLAGDIAGLDRRRCEIVEQLCEHLELPASQPPGSVSIRVLLTHLSAPHVERLGEPADRLRARMLEAAEANRVVEMACRQLLDWYRELFRIVAADETETLTYAPDGKTGAGRGVRVLDAVG